VQSQTQKYLFVEHLPLLQEGFQNAINHISENTTTIRFQGSEIKRSDDFGVSIAQLLEDSSAINFIWLNMDFPIPSQDKHNPFSIASTLMKTHPEARILITLQQATVYALRKIFQKINPHVVLELVDCDQQTIIKSLIAIIHKEIFYSKTILLLLHKFLQTFEAMDNADYAILHELDKGAPVTHLPKKVLLSHSTILTRRTQLKTLFNLSGKTDADLLREVKRQGYI